MGRKRKNRRRGGDQRKNEAKKSRPCKMMVPVLQCLDVSVAITTTNFTDESIQSIDRNAMDQNVDVTLVGRDISMKVHGSIVGARNDYFDLLLRNHNFREAQETHVYLKFEMQPSVFRAVIEFLYTGTIELSSNNLGAVIEAADYFRLDKLFAFCLRLLADASDCDTAGHIYDFAAQFLSAVPATTAALDFMLENFEAIHVRSCHRAWSRACVCAMIASKHLEVSEEDKVVRFVFDWCEYNAADGEAVDEMLQNIILSQIRNIREIKNYPDDQLIKHFNRAKRTVSRLPSATPRLHYNRGLYVTGHDSNGAHIFELRCPIDGSVKVLKPPPVSFDSQFTSVQSLLVHNGTVCLFDNKGDDFKISYTYCAYQLRLRTYEPSSNTWHPWSTYRKLNSDVAVCFCSYGASIYGFIDYSTHCNERSEVWRFNSGKWNPYGKWLPQHRQIAYATPCDGNIYLASSNSTKIFKFNPSTPPTEEWPAITCPFDPRLHEAVPYRTQILFFPKQVDTEKTDFNFVVFCTSTNAFRPYSVDLGYPSATKIRSMLYKEAVYFVFPDRAKSHYYQVRKMNFDIAAERFQITEAPGWRTEIGEITSMASLH